MRAGLLVCDHVKDEYQKEFGDYPDMFAALLPELEWTLYDVVNGIFPKDLDECDVYMATGSKHSVYEPLAWIKELKELVRSIYRSQKYFIGFCFGHQLIGESLGGRVAKSPNGWCVGVHSFDIWHQKSWMSPAIKNLSLLMMCQDQIIDLPTDSKILGGNDMCPVGLIQVGDRVLGIQAHPEFTKAYDLMLMETRMNRMGDDVAAKGIESLSVDIHPEVIRSWILRFLGL